MPIYVNTIMFYLLEKKIKIKINLSNMPGFNVILPSKY